MKLTVQDEFFARDIGWRVVEYLRREHPESLVKNVERDALRVLEKVKQILDDDSLDDPECFRRIEAIVETFYASGLSTTRHDW